MFRRNKVAPDDDVDLDALAVADPAFAARAQAAGDWAIKRLDESLQQMISQSVESARWLLASLLSLNAGAIGFLATAHDFFRPEALPLPIEYFVAGCVAAVGCGLLGMVSPLVVAGSLGQSVGLWQSVALDGTGLRDALLSTQKMQRRTLPIFIATIAVGLVSVGFFVAGVLAVSNAMIVR